MFYKDYFPHKQTETFNYAFLLLAISNSVSRKLFYLRVLCFYQQLNVLHEAFMLDNEYDTQQF